LRLSRVKGTVLRKIASEKGVSVRLVQMWIVEKHEEIGPLYTRRISSYVVALEKGVDVTEYMDETEKETVRQFMGPNVRYVSVESEPKEKKVPRKRVLRFPDKFESDCPKNLSETVLKEAIEMSGVYPYIYLLENSIRSFIKEVMDKIDPNWWDTSVKKSIQKDVEDRMNREIKNRYHGKRGVHPIQYVDFDHLRTIIARNREHFEEYLPDNSIQWLTQRLKELKESRNILAHNNPLTENDVRRLKTYYEDWISQISK